MSLDAWRFSAQLAWQDRLMKLTLLFIAAFFCLGTFFLLQRLIPEGERTGMLTLHYNVYLGIDDVRDWRWVFVIPSALGGILLLNLVWAFGVYRSDPLFAKMLTLFSAGFLAVALVHFFFFVTINS